MRGRDELDRLVTGAHRRRLLSLAGECLILGAAALLSAATVAVLGGDEARRPAVWSAAALCGALIAASRWMGSGREKRATAHRLDRGLDMGGALTTACEPRAASPLRRLLVRRVAEGADGGRARGLFPPPSPALLALPLAAGALLALAVRTAGPSEADPGDLERLAQALASARGAALSAPAGEDAGPQASRSDLAGRLERLAGRLAGIRQGPPSDPDRRDAALTALSKLERELGELEARLPEGGPRRELERARLLATEARRRLAGVPGTPSGAGSGAGEEPGGGTPSGPMLADGAAERTMSGPPREGAPPPDAGGAATPEPGVLAGRWWPEEHDGIVSRWVEHRRQASPRGD